MTAQMATRLMFRSFKHKKRKVSIDLYTDWYFVVLNYFLPWLDKVMKSELSTSKNLNILCWSSQTSTLTSCRMPHCNECILKLCKTHWNIILPSPLYCSTSKCTQFFKEYAKNTWGVLCVCVFLLLFLKGAELCAVIMQLYKWYNVL